ncbi:MAG: endopeptidase La [Oscillospiraceae bacterium]|nr:endopeptidase La [Oscillospiraceae bacterium]
MRGMVVFPYMTLNFDAGRDVSIKALEAAVNENSMVFLAAQKNAGKENPKPEDIHTIGTVAKIKQVLHMPGGVTRVVVGGIRRGAIREVVSVEPYFKAVIEEFDEFYNESSMLEEAYVNRLRKAYEEYFAQNQRLAAEKYMTIMSINNMGRLCDTIAADVDIKIEVKQEILEELDIYKRIEKLIAAIQNRLQVMKIEKKISHRVKERIDKNQKEYYLREQRKVIQDELGDKDGIGADVSRYKEEISKIKAAKDTKEKLKKEVDRFEKMAPQSAESAVLRNYLDAVLELPWNKSTKETFDIAEAEKILDEDHYGLEKVKERILEYLSVRHFTKGKNGTILCLVGPPGVGKTSVSKSIARALNRKYVRVSLGGIHDEADIRGHRKTYIGAMEGRIIAAVREAKVKNPLILLDEVDKMGADYKGDPSAALLEVLDYEQNSEFRDHYIEVPFDLSQVLFITTANTLDTVSRPLLDRMEIIELSSYTDAEKFHIAKNYLIKKSLDKTGLDKSLVSIADNAIRDIISGYTREAGVRRLEQQINSVCRKAAKNILEKNKKSIKVTSKNLSEYLGKKRYRCDLMNMSDQIGVVRGLAWTAVGGTTLSIEVNVMPGTGKLELTGQLGDVMKESAMAAISYIRSRAKELDITEDFYKTKDIHIHVPEGAVPKDGPSAGITMATALVSALSEKPARNDIAMTGEITLRGRVLPIGGLKEKSLAAYQAGIRDIIIPVENKPDVDDVPKEIRNKLTFIPVDNMDIVLENALR